MFNIAEYLRKFTRLEGDLAFHKEVIKRALKEVCNLENVEFETKNGTLYIKENPAVKSIIFMKKTALIEYLRREFPKGRIGDAR